MATPISQIRFLQQQAASLLLYQAVLENPVGRAFLELLDLLAASQINRLAVLWAYGQWFHRLANEEQSWQTFVLHQILRADNPFSRQAQQRSVKELPTGLVAAAWHDLRALQHLYGCSGQQVSEWVRFVLTQTAGSSLQPDPAPVVWHDNTPVQPSLSPQLWTTFETAEDWTTVLEDLADYYKAAGVGPFAQYHAFRWQSEQLVGVEYPDPIRLDALVGYERQRNVLLQNTLALLENLPALHVLLYGSRGTGKSSLIKSLLNESGDLVGENSLTARGLRLVEVPKTALQDLPLIVDHLRHAPQKFIIFVDDLSFEEDDDAFKALKVVLEGNVTARPQNVVVYATSNRRHLIREYFADRPRPQDADEVNSWDTVQEKLSFSDRFGLTITFEPADQATYLAIVRHLADQANLSISPQELEFRALQWATQHNGRSGRTARQFIDFLQAEIRLQTDTRNNLLKL